MLFQLTLYVQAFTAGNQHFQTRTVGNELHNLVRSATNMLKIIQ